jgi:hypothetical protein
MPAQLRLQEGSVLSQLQLWFFGSQKRLQTDSGLAHKGNEGPAPKSCVDHHTPTAMLAEHAANKSMSVQHNSPIISVLHAQHRHYVQGFSTTLINGDPAIQTNHRNQTWS